MDYEFVVILSQAGTGVATLAVALFLSIQLRLQHKEATIAAHGDLTRGFADIVRDVYSNHELADIYLRGKDKYKTLEKQELHRFNVLLWSYYLQIQQMWETGVNPDKVHSYATTMLNSGQGILDWWSNMGRHVYPSDFVLYIESILTSA